MSTIDSQPIIQEMLRNDGTYPGDPQMDAILSYVNSFGKKTYKLIYGSPEQCMAMMTDVYTSPYVNQPILLWSKAEGLTGMGELELEAH